MIILLFLILWGINVWLLDKSRIQYHSALRYSVQISTVFYTSFALLALFSIIMTYLTSTLNLVVETGILIFYGSLFFISFSPFAIPGSESRIPFYRLLKIVFFPTNVISFPEVLLADALTSLARSFKDISVTLLVLYCYFTDENIVDYHEIGIISIAILSSLPYWIRVRQCSVQFMGATEDCVRLPVFLNILKYCSAFPPIWLAASQGLGYKHSQLLTFMTVAATINSLYSYAWDISMDWGLIQFTRTWSYYFRQRCLYHPIFYVCAMIINLILRFSWLAPNIALFRNLHSSNLIILLQLLEVFRRSMWFMFRIEWEVIVQEEKLRSVKDKDEWNDGGTSINSSNVDTEKMMSGGNGSNHVALSTSSGSLTTNRPR